VRRRAPAAALIEQHDAIFLRVEELAVPRLDAAAGPAVHEQHRLAVGIAALLDVQLVQFRNLEALGPIRLDGGIGLRHGRLFSFDREAGC
jgi:hypothetical protein